MIRSKLVDFFIVGAPRCGTTSLYNYLNQHPSVFMSDCKEPEFFATDISFNHAVKSIEDYHNLFLKANTDQIKGEASTFYLFSQEAAKNIKTYNPNAKIIIMLRNPIEQMLSFHNTMLSIYWENSEVIMDFNKAILLEDDRKTGKQLPKDTTMPQICYHYSEIAKYYKQAKRYFTIFDKQRILIILFDDFKSETQHVFKNLCDFLEIDIKVKIDFKQYNTVGSPYGHLFFKLLRKIPKNIRMGKFNRLFTFLWELNTTNKNNYSISEVTLKKLKEKFISEVENLSLLINKNLMELWLYE